MYIELMLCGGDNDSIYLKFLLEYNFLNYFHGE